MQPLDRWNVAPQKSPSVLRGIAYGNEVFVVAGCEGALMYSKDGYSWTQAAINYVRNGGPHFSDVTYGNGVFVAVGWEHAAWDSDPGWGTIFTSADGISWTERRQGVEGFIRVAFAGGTFIAILPRFKAMLSSDGSSWSYKDWGDDIGNIYDVCFENGIYVAVGDTICTSFDLISWKRLKDNTNLSEVVFGNGLFLSCGRGGETWVSDNFGQTWYTRSSVWQNPPWDYVIYGLTYADGIFVAVGSDGKIATTTDGTSWQDRTSNSFRTHCAVTFAKNTFVAVGESGSILQSDPLNSKYLTVLITGPCGYVISSPPGILSSNDCTAPFQPGTTVYLKAIPEPSRIWMPYFASIHFSEWSGAVSSREDQCAVTVADDMTIIANFARREFHPADFHPHLKFPPEILGQIKPLPLP